jgi:hypothetical protein
MCNSVQTLELKPIVEVTDRQAQVIDDLVAGLPTATAARRCRVARRTVYYWLNAPAFQAAIADRRQRITDRVTHELAELALVAIRRLEDQLADHSDDFAHGIRYWHNPHRIRLAKDLLLAMGLPIFKLVPRLEGEGRDPEAPEVRGPRGDD